MTHATHFIRRTSAAVAATLATIGVLAVVIDLSTRALVL